VAQVAPATIAGALAAATRCLDAAGVPEPRRDARLLVEHALGVSREVVLGHPERAVGAGEAARIAALVELRAGRRPVSRVLGVREFWSLPFQVTADTLDPRPDSEAVVEAALEGVADRDRPLRLLDLGTGTGCLLLALLSELPRAQGVGVDVSSRACAVARRNAASLGLDRRASFVVGDWGRGLAGAFDLVVANPPYVPETEIDGLEPEVSLFEPGLALRGGSDGLACYRALAPDLARLLAPGGRAVMEVGAAQASAVRSIFAARGMVWVATRRDLAGHERCVILAREGEDRRWLGKSGGGREKKLGIRPFPGYFRGRGKRPGTQAASLTPYKALREPLCLYVALRCIKGYFRAKCRDAVGAGENSSEGCDETGFESEAFTRTR
jgi:release factor glutamine methyltransferase